MPFRCRYGAAAVPASFSVPAEEMASNTIACTDCSRCGKCYDKHGVCAACGGAVNLLDDACPACGEPITDAMRDRAKQAYLDKKKAEHARILELAAAAKARREERPVPVYPWDEPVRS